MKILLVGNYEGDGQWSMDRFSRMLLNGFPDEMQVEMIQPVAVFGKHLKNTPLSKWLGYIDKYVLFWFALRRAVAERPGWVVHVVDQGNGIYAGWASGCVVTCHDLLAIKSARGEIDGVRTGWTGRIYQRLILRGLRKACRLVAVSEATRADLARLIGESVVIPNGLEDIWKPMAGASPGGGFLLHVGGDQWYKNRAAVVRIFIALRRETPQAPRLMMVGPELDAASQQAIEKAGLTGDVVVISRGATNEGLRTLYATARAFIFPSLAEGFGWPILEAQACGCPVLTTNREPMSTTGGDAAIRVNDGEWVAAISKVLEMDEAKRAALAEAGKANAGQYTVDRMIAGYLDIYSRS